MRDKKQIMNTLIKRLRREYPSLKCGLSFNSPFELLVATILSAQSTDVHINKITPGLFRKYRSVRDIAFSDPESFRMELRSVNFYNNKARNIQAASRMILDRFNGEVPKSMDELTALPGVARKTANIILYNAYGIADGIAVDTHVRRLANRLGLTQSEDPVKIEKDLTSITPKKDWGDLTHLFISHGRSVCNARRPLHEKCVLADLCPSKDI